MDIKIAEDQIKHYFDESVMHQINNIVKKHKHEAKILFWQILQSKNKITFELGMLTTTNELFNYEISKDQYLTAVMKFKDAIMISYNKKDQTNYLRVDAPNGASIYYQTHDDDNGKKLDEFHESLVAEYRRLEK